VVLAFSGNTAFSMMHLGQRYAEAVNEATAANLVAAGTGVMAMDMWHSTGGYISGILLQGAGVLISLVMLRGRDFSRFTAWAGFLGNGLDLVQHLMHPFTDVAGTWILMIAGPFYLAWFPLLGWDLLRQAKRAHAGVAPATR